MDYSDDDLRFEFRDPYYSDEDDGDDEDANDVPGLAELGDDEEFQPRDSLDNRKSRDPNIVGETSKSNETFPYVQASELERILETGISLLGQSSGEPAGGTSSGPGPTTSNAADPDAFLDLRNDLQQVLSKFTDPKEAVTVEEFRGDADAAVVEVPDETGKASNSYLLEYADDESEILPTRERIVAWNKRDSPELDHEFERREGTPAELHVHNSDETRKGKLALIGPALRSLRTAINDLASRSETLQTWMVESVKVGGGNTVSEKSRMERVLSGPEETNAISHPETPDGRPEASQKKRSGNEDEEETFSATLTGPSDERSKIRAVLSRRQRLHERLWNSRMDELTWVCSRCGVQQNIQSKDDFCIICSDGNRLGNFSLLAPVWMSHTEVESLNVENSFHLLEPDLFYQIHPIARSFQSHRAIFLKLPEGNILWDCLTYIDQKTVVEIAKMGGLKGIAISSPDRIGSCGRISYIFNRCPTYIHMRDRAYLPRSKNGRVSWNTEEKYLGDGVTLIHLGGHFPGSCILHLNHRGGIVFSSNALKVGADRKSVSVMLDYTRYIPACANDVTRILHIMESLEFDQVWGDQPGEEILEQAKPKVISSLQRYIRWTEHDEENAEFHQDDEDNAESQTQPLTKREEIAKGKRKLGDQTTKTQSWEDRQPLRTRK